MGEIQDNPNETASFKATVGGTTFTQEERNALEYLVIEDHVDKIGVATLTIAGGEAALPTVAIGDDVEVQIGGSSRKIFKGYVTSLRHHWKSGFESLTVVAMDPLIKLASYRATKVWGGEPTDKIKDSDVVSDLISDAGASAGTVDTTSGESPYIFQRNETNLNMAKRLAARNGYLLMANEGKIDFVKPQFSGDAIEVTEQDVLALESTLSDTSIPTNVTVYGWDYVKKEMVTATKGPSDIDKIGGGSEPAPTTWTSDHYIVDVRVAATGSAEAMAKGEMDRLARSYVRGRITVQGNGNLYAGVKVKVSGQFKGYNAEGYVISSKHVVEPNQGMKTQVTFVGNTKPE